MKITKTRLKEIIVEELQNVMGEMYDEDESDNKESSLYVKYEGGARDLVARKYPGHLEKYEDEGRIYVGNNLQLKFDFEDLGLGNKFDGDETYVIDQISSNTLKDLMKLY